jgi:hypothetical protein
VSLVHAWVEGQKSVAQPVAEPVAPTA